MYIIYINIHKIIIVIILKKNCTVCTWRVQEVRKTSVEK